MTDPNAVVFVVDDDESVRSSIASLLRSVGLAVQCFGSAREFLTGADVNKTACMVLDVRLPGTSGLDLQRELAERDIQIPIVFITGHGDIPMTVRAMKAGAVEFLSKPFRDQELLEAIEAALTRSQKLRSERVQEAELRGRFDSLTQRERQVFELVAQGMLNKQVASNLGITEVTVKIHRARVMQKMHASSLADLVRMAERVFVQSQAAHVR